MKLLPLTRRAVLMAASALSIALPATAHDYRVGDLAIDHPWARATVPGQKAGGAFLKIENRGTTADRLLSAAAPTDRVASTELHSMRMEGNIMRMREVAAIDLPAGQTVALEPGGLHIMFMGLKSPLKAGEKLPLVLTFEKAGTVTVEVHVEAVSAAPAKNHGDGGHHRH
jgi:copper(I)-binding protein